MNKSKKRFVFFKIYLFCSDKHLCFQLDAFITKHMAQGLVNGVLSET